MKHLLLTLFTPILLALACYAALLVFDLYVKSYGQEKNITVIIPKGAGLKEISTLMAEQKIVPAPWVFQAMVVRFGQRGKLKAGEYLFLYAASAYADMMQMARGEVVIHKITIPEGWTTSRIYALLQNEQQLTGDINPIYREGDLLPETYRYEHGDTRADMLERMHNAMEIELQKINPAFTGEEKKRILTLASIVEKETRKPDERPRVAAVYLNRYRIGMKLQADPTVIYALTKGQGELGRPLLLGDLTFDSPYNTYRYVGLPPGPICNPGKAAIEAVVHSLHTDEFYFVADGTGGHRFARTEKEHEVNVKSFRAWEKVHPQANR